MDATLRAELAEVEERHWWYEGRRRVLARAISGLELRSGANILEAGCGNGANLAMLARFGIVSGFEPDEEDCRRAAVRELGAIAPGRLPDRIPFEDKRFDLILAADVLEHIRDDMAAANAMGARLSPDGWLVVTVPAHPWLWTRHDERNQHERRYTKAALVECLRTADLDIRHMSYFNTWLFPGIAPLRLLARARGRDAGGTRVPAAAVNRMLTRILGSEARWATGPGLPFGLSLLAICRPGTTTTGPRKPDPNPTG